MESDLFQSGRRWLPGSAAGRDYDAFIESKLAGQNPHGEADFVETLGGRSVLDAGCGTGRIGIELARRGLDMVGVDLDPAMIARARDKAPALDWRLGDLATIDLGRTFDCILLAGNVMIFLAPGTEGQVVTNLARHLSPGGALVAGFQLLPGRLTLGTYDRLALAAGLQLAERWTTWHRNPWQTGAGYAVSVHRLPTVHRP